MVGVLLAVSIACVAATWPDGNRDAAPTPPRTLVLHYQPVLEDAWRPIATTLLAHLPRDTRVVIVTKGRAEERACRRLLDEQHLTELGVRFVHTILPVSPWARDRYIPFTRGSEQAIYLPPEHAVPAPERGSLEVPAALARADARLRLVRSHLRLEGGDVLTTPTRVLLGAHTLMRNTGAESRTEAQFRADVEALFGRKCLLVAERPQDMPGEHCDTFLTLLDDRTALLGDPRLGLEAWDGPRPKRGQLLFENDLGRFLRSRQKEVSALYERIAAHLVACGFRVSRLPVLHGERFSERRRGVLLNWNNVVLDRRDRRVYLPSYGEERLDAMARSVWLEHGYEPVPVDVRKAIVHGGAVRCMTSTLGLD